jgi:hypothetical protein
MFIVPNKCPSRGTQVLLTPTDLDTIAYTVWKTSKDSGTDLGVEDTITNMHRIVKGAILANRDGSAEWQTINCDYCGSLQCARSYKRLVQITRRHCQAAVEQVLRSVQQ